MKPIAIVGMPGSGKTTVGKLLSGYLGLKFVDMDREIEKTSGCTIPEIFKRFGEREFRRREKELLRKLIAEKEIVISTGGGVVIDIENREMLLKDAKTFYIDVPIEEIEKRKDNLNDRPLLSGDPGQKLRELYEKRKGFYKMFEPVKATDISPEAVAALIARKVKNIDERHIENKIHPVIIKKIDKSYIKEIPVVSTHIVWKIYGDLHPKKLHLMPDGEDAKKLSEIEKLYKTMIGWNIDRGNCVIAMGGGALTDSVGFATATFKRGCRLINIPTTLLGQVDAAIGGKNAINFSGIKNIIGTFKLPEYVISDPFFPLSMDYKRYVEGIVEGIKTGLVASLQLFEFIEAHVDELTRRDVSAIAEFAFLSASAKLKVVAGDIYDRSNRMILNFGHTVGHAIESAYQLTHGEAVAVGMLIASVAGTKMGISNPDIHKRIIEILKKLKSFPNIKIDVDKIWSNILQDKKIQKGDLRFIFLKGIGKPIISSIDPNILKNTLEEIAYENPCD